MEEQNPKEQKHSLDALICKNSKIFEFGLYKVNWLFFFSVQKNNNVWL